MSKTNEKYTNEEILSLKEAVQHGDFLLPFDIYRTRMPEYFNSFPIHWHEEIEIVYVKGGYVEFNIDLETYVAEENDIAIIPPCVLHSFKQYNGNEAHMLTMMFNMSMLTNNSTDACSIRYFTPFYERQLSMPYIIKRDHPSYSKIRDIYLSIVDTYDKKRDFYELTIKSKLYELFYVFFAECFEKIDYDTTLKNNTTKNIKAILDYISENYMNSITIEELSASVNLSKHYFMRFFKKYMGTTCIEYINDYRLNIATNMLLTTNSQITEIATSIGITNLSYFNRIFKKKYNMTPKEYRRSLENKRVDSRNLES